MADAKLILTIAESMFLDGATDEHRTVDTKIISPLHPIVAIKYNFASTTEVFDGCYAVRFSVLRCARTNLCDDATQSNVLTSKGCEVIHLCQFQIADIL